MITPATFRVLYPAFSDLGAYSPDAVQWWIDQAYARLDPVRWAELLDDGVLLFVAHRLALNAAAAAATSGGGAGVISSKSVGGVSVAYNFEIGSVPGSGAYNQTAYGRQFAALVNMIGMGGIQL